MSFFQLPDSFQMWSNAAFDDGASASAAKISSTPPPPPLREVSTNSFAPVDLDPSKENRGPEAIRPAIDGALLKKATPRVSFGDDAEVDQTALDDEISRIEEEITRMGSRLEALRAKKAERESRGRQPRGRIVPAKFMDPKQGAAARNPCTPASKRMDRAMEVAPARAGIRRRGVSLGPLEILATPSRPIGPRPSPAKNLWPSALKKKTEESPAPVEKADHQSGKANETPTGSVHDHKIPGLGKLENLEEDKETTKNINFDPKSQSPATAKNMTTEAKKTLDNRRRAISLGPVEIVSSVGFRRQNNLQEHADKAVDKQPKRSSSISPAYLNASVSAKKFVTDIIKPKALFQENQSSTSCKRTSKAGKGRIVPSRYSLTGTRTTTGETQGNKRGKWSLPELSRGKTCALVTGSPSMSTPDRKRSHGSGFEDQMNTDLQMLDELDVVVRSLSFTPSSPQSIMKLAAMLPKIKTLRCNTKSPRDSGCAKRAAELVRRQPFFAVSEDEVLNSPRQPLKFLPDEFPEQQP